jgi:hypothetical protein
MRIRHGGEAGGSWWREALISWERSFRELDLEPEAD